MFETLIEPFFIEDYDFWGLEDPCWLNERQDPDEEEGVVNIGLNKCYYGAKPNNAKMHR